jgi:hypothetical protein
VSACGRGLWVLKMISWSRGWFAGFVAPSRCHGVVGILDVGLDACETIQSMNATLYGTGLDRHSHIDALAQYSRYVLFELAIYSTQILSGVGGPSQVGRMQARALKHAH